MLANNPKEYFQIPSESSAQDPQASTEAVRREVESVYSNQTNNVYQFPVSVVAEKESEPKIIEQSDEISKINEEIDSLREKYLEIIQSGVTELNIVKAIKKKILRIKALYIDELNDENGLIRRESREVGSKLFGELPPNVHIEFFKDSHGDWFFYYELTKADGKKISITLHYEILPAGILCINSKSGVKEGELIGGEHLDNFILAIQKYHEDIKDLYQSDEKAA